MDRQPGARRSGRAAAKNRGAPRADGGADALRSDRSRFDVIASIPTGRRCEKTKAGEAARVHTEGGRWRGKEAPPAVRFPGRLSRFRVHSAGHTTPGRSRNPPENQRVSEWHELRL